MWNINAVFPALALLHGHLTHTFLLSLHLPQLWTGLGFSNFFQQPKSSSSKCFHKPYCMTAVLLCNSQKVRKCLWMDGWMDEQKTCYIHTTEYYSALKRKNIPTHAATWRSLENILGETSQTQKHKYWTIPLIHSS